MALKWTRLLWAMVFVMPATAQTADDFQQRCLSFLPEEGVRNSTRTVLEYVPANTMLDFPDNDASCGRPSQFVSVDICRVALSIPTSDR